MVQALAAINPSWPFRTQSARTVWQYAERLFEEHPDWPLHQIVRQAFEDSGVPSREFTSDDYSILSMAMRWKSYVLKGNDAPPSYNIKSLLPLAPR